MTFGFGLSEIVNVSSTFSSNNTNTSLTEHTGKRKLKLLIYILQLL